MHTYNDRTENLHEALELLNKAAKEKREDLMKLIAGKYEDAKEAFSEALEEPADGFKEKGKEFASMFAKAQEEAKRKFKTASTTVTKSVHHNPWAFIGGAALCGFFAGLLIHHRR